MTTVAAATVGALVGVLVGALWTCSGSSAPCVTGPLEHAVMTDDPDLVKMCARCRRALPLSEFPLRRKTAPHRYGHCRECKAAYQRQWYERNKDRHRANVAANNAATRRANKDIVNRLKDRPCQDCGGHFPPYVMDFDHVRGTKIRDVARLKMQGTQKALLDEIAKCDVVCANCHRIRTHERRQQENGQ